MQRSTPKHFKRPAGGIRTLAPLAPVALMSCRASDRITVDGMPVGSMWRDEPGAKETGSGWHFFCAQDSPDFIADPSNSETWDLNTICNYDPAIIPYLDSPVGTRLVRIPGTDRFQPG